MMLGDNFLINGVKIIEDRNMVVDGEPYEVERTWRERLFTRPWKPLKTVNIVIPKIPSTKVIQYDGAWIMHPAMITKLQEGIDNVHKSEL